MWIPSVAGISKLNKSEVIFIRQAAVTVFTRWHSTCITSNYFGISHRALYGDAVLVPIGGAKNVDTVK